MSRILFVSTRVGFLFSGILIYVILVYRIFWINLQLLPNHSKENKPITTFRKKATSAAATTTTVYMNQINCSEQTNVAFIKVHKAGSTTVLNILQRFGETRRLLIAFPESKNFIRFNFSNLVPIPKGRSYNILLNHIHHYDRVKIAKVMYPNTKYIGIVRKPMDQVVSAFEYYSRGCNRKARGNGCKRIYKKIPGEHKLLEYLTHTHKYEPSNPRLSYTNNRMSLDFGLPSSHFHNTTAIKGFIKKLESEMDLVLILEWIAESLVLLKRRFCWSIKDILYLPRNVNGNKAKTRIAFTNEDLRRHRNFSLPDFMLYEHFLARFNEIVEAEGPGFTQEVDVFNEMLFRTKEYCEIFAFSGWADANQGDLVFNRTAFSEPFVVTTDDCQMMLASEVAFINRTRLKQLNYVKQLNLYRITSGLPTNEPE